MCASSAASVGGAAASGPGIPELVAALQRRGQQVFLVSGGFRPIINPIAAMLDIPLDNVYANTILHQVPHGLPARPRNTGGPRSPTRGAAKSASLCQARQTWMPLKLRGALRAGRCRWHLRRIRPNGVHLP